MPRSTHPQPSLEALYIILYREYISSLLITYCFRADRAENVLGSTYSDLHSSVPSL